MASPRLSASTQVTAGNRLRLPASNLTPIGYFSSLCTATMAEPQIRTLPSNRSGLTCPRFAPRTPAPREPLRPARRFATPRSCPPLRPRPVGSGKAGTEEGAILEPATHEDAMTKRHQAKYKIDRRVGQNVGGRPKSPVNRRRYGPG